jgi:hypothetical protein
MEPRTRMSLSGAAENSRERWRGLAFQKLGNSWCLRSVPGVRKVCPVCVTCESHKLIGYSILKWYILQRTDPRRGETPHGLSSQSHNLGTNLWETGMKSGRSLTPRFEPGGALRRTTHTQVVHTNTRRAQISISYAETARRSCDVR